MSDRRAARCDNGTIAVPQRHRRIARWELAWFALAFVASPAVTPMANPQRFQVQEVCLAIGGIALVMTSIEPASGMDAHALDCPMCLPALATGRGVPARDPITESIAVIVRAAGHRAARAASSMPPARGPPALS